MTHFWTRAAMIGLAGGAMSACATPQYPTAEGQAAREPLTLPTANFPITQGGAQAVLTPPQTPAAAPSGGTVQSAALPPPASTAPTATAVASQPLAPLASQVVTTRTIPVAAGKVVDAEGKPVMYEVQSGDTLYGIARKLGTSVTQLADDNGLSPPYRLTPGQTLKGPAPKTKAYTVMSGDTLYAIARRFSVRAQDIAQANEIALATPINVGQRLLLPPGYRDTGPSTRTITSTQPRYEPPAQTPIPATTTVAQNTAVPPLPVTPRPYTPPAATATPVTPRPYTPPATSTVTPKPYTPPATSTVTPRPYTPPATTVTPRPYTPPATTPSNPIVATGAPPTDNEVAAAGRGRFLWPVRGDIVSGFGPKGGGQRNDGLNIRAPSGSQVQAAAAGEVVYAGDQVPGFGNLVLVKHDGGWVTAYAHLGRIDVKMRDRVTQGQALGSVGSTGGVAEPQLHFEVRYAPSPKDKARPVDPSLVLPG